MLSFSSNVTRLVKDDFAFRLRTAQSQYINVYKHCYGSLDRMRIGVIRCKPHILSLRHFKFSFNGFTDFYSFKVASSSDTRKNKA